jgi:Ca-activated chloride channel homolog
MTFGRPLLLLTLLIVPAAVGIYFLVRRRQMRYAVAYTNLDVLATVTSRYPWRRIVPAALFLLAIATLCTATARPHVKSMVPQEHATVILVLDASRSMQARDVKPSRLGAAEEAVNAFLDRVPKRLQVGMVVFAGDAQVAAPPTTDHELVRESLHLVENYPGYSGTAIGDALQVAVDLGKQALLGGRSGGPTIAYRVGEKQSPKPGALVSILFLSDGRQTTGALLPLQGAALAKAAGFPVYTVALGTRNARLPGLDPNSFSPFATPGQPNPFNLAPDRKTLRAIARATGGEYFPARNAAAANTAYSKLGSQLGRKSAHVEVTFAFIAGAAVLVVLAGVLSAFWSPRIP